MKQEKRSLLEATLLALQGKLIVESVEPEIEETEIAVIPEVEEVATEEEKVCDLVEEIKEEVDTVEEKVEELAETLECETSDEETEVEEEPTEEIVKESKDIEKCDDCEDCENCVKKEESIDVNVTENTTVVDTDEATVIVTDKEEVIEEPIETIEAPIIEEPIEVEEVIEEPIEEVEEEIVEESKELVTESSDATEEFINDLGELLKKHTRANVASLKLDNEGNKVTITFNNGATKEVDIEADSNTAAIQDIVKKVENTEIKPEEDSEEIKIDLDSFQTKVEGFLKSQNSKIESYSVDNVVVTENKIVVEGKVTRENRPSTSLCLEMNKYKAGQKFAKYKLHESKGLIIESKQNTEAITMTTFLNEEKGLECKFINKK